MVKDAITQKIAQLKEYNAIPEDYKFNVNFVSTDKVPNEFSLGKYSFMEKMATNTVSNRAVPVIIADQSTIKSVNDLINMASGIVNKRENIERKQSELNDTKNRLKK
jgi:hypothetical protein